MDPVREARVRRMVPDKSTWPLRDVIHVYRLSELHGYEVLGTITDPTPPYVVFGLDNIPWTYQTLDGLIAAGWCVD